MPWKAQKPEPFVKTLTLRVPFGTSRRFGDIQGLISAMTDVKTGNILAANIEEIFNDSLEEISKKMPFSVSFEELFENAVGRINLMLQRLLGQNGLPITAAETHGVIIAQKGHEVTAAVWGKPSLVLFRRDSENEPKLFNILETEIENSLAQSVGIGFTNLINGKINGRDRLVVSNRNLLDLLTEDQLREILSVSETAVVTNLLSEALVAEHENLNLALLMLDGGESSTDEELPTKQQVNNSEMVDNQNITKKELNLFKKITERLKNRNQKIHPLVAQWFKNSGRKLFILLKNGVQKIFKKKSKQSNEPNPNKEPESLIDPAPKELIEVDITEDGSLPVKKNLLKRFWRNQSQKLTTYAKKWNLSKNRNKQVLMAILILAIVLISGVVAVEIKQTREKTLARYEKTVAEIKQQMNSAEASMIYRDETRAKRLLSEASAALTNLPTDNKNQLAIKEQLTQEMKAKFAGLRRAITLETPKVLSKVVTQTEDINLQKLIVTNSTLWTIASNGMVFQVSPTDGTASMIATGDNKSPQIAAATDNGLLIGNETDLKIISSKGKISAQSINLANSKLKSVITDSTIYNSRLYLLEATDDHIIKFSSTTGGFDSPQIYNKEATELSSAISFTIDGHVYVLLKNGAVVNFLNGKVEKFQLDTIEPAITSPIAIETPSADADLFILDPANHRLARFDKTTGHLIAQYESLELEGATSFQIDQNKHTILITKENKILKFTWMEK